MKNFKYLLSPVLFSIIPILLLYSHNVESVSYSDLYRSLLFTLVGGISILFPLWILLKELKLACLLTSLFLLFFYSYGHVYGGYLGPTAQKIFRAGGLVGNSLLLFSFWSLLFFLSVLIISRLRYYWEQINSFFLFGGIVLLVIPSYRIISYEVRINSLWRDETPQIPLRYHERSSNPDIYYIILDGYGRADILDDYYSFDNSEFVSFLEDNGFFVADNSYSNYVQTALSLSSSLNMRYLDFLTQKYGEGNDPAPMASLTNWNQVGRNLKLFDYKIVTTSTGYRMTEITNADIFNPTSSLSSSNFERLLFETSALVLLNDVRNILNLPPYYPGYRSHQERVLETFNYLETSYKIPGPKFVFTHIIAPHPPFIFSSQGELTQPSKPFNILDGSVYLGDMDEYVQGYVEQLIFINSQMKEIIREILMNSDNPPIIVIQGDHGPGSRFDWDSPDEDGLRERFGILNAYYLPGVPLSELYDEISPVNSFRLIFNRYFRADYQLLRDDSYYSNWVEPYQFEKIELE